MTGRSNEFGDHTLTTTLSLSARPTPSLQFSISPEYADENGTSSTFNGPINRQYLTTQAGGRPETYGKRYIFGLVDRTTLSSQFRVSYTFKPDVTLDVYAEPFAASGRYRRVRRDARPAQHEPADVRHRRHDDRAAAERRLSGHRRRVDVRRSPIATSTSGPTAATSC